MTMKYKQIVVRIRRGTEQGYLRVLDVGHCVLYPEGPSLLLTHEDTSPGGDVFELSLTRDDAVELRTRIDQWLRGRS